ncbi:hypothetical protein C1645_519722 [Glomus cerebriforme]|uniref:Uncharacterized protein n=1 Tax=Glomus cerebriforme TaxID=658196 RepID=A0A397TM91_9GLOM|nr:hypothetical protein C1645_519722 [Glomus cerebriforme]
MARLTATPVPKCGGANSLPGSCYENKTGPALDKNSPFITRETKLNFETMQNSLLIQEKENREDTENEGDPMDICDEQLKTTETTDVSLSNSEIINITASIYKELDDRVAQLKALPTPERKKILGMDNVKTEIPTITPFRKNSESSLIKQTSSSSVNRFTQVHEKVFSKMPSIVTHYAAQRTKKVEETQDEINRKRKDPDDSQSSFKKQKLVHSIQDNQVTKAAKDIYKKVEKDKETVKPVMKRTYDRNRTTSNIRSSIRLNLAKGKNASQVEPSARTSSNVQESQRKQLSYVQRRGPVKSIIPNPDEQRKKKREELEKRKQAARNGMLYLY